MRRKPARLAILLCAGLVAGLLAAPIEANASHAATYEVRVASFLSQTVPAESMRFFPSRLTVHQGDKIHFTSESFHTATMLPENTDAFVWIEDNAPAIGGPFSLEIPDPDDGAGDRKANPAAIFPSDPTCGSADNPCDYDGSDVVNSGVFVFGPGELTATVNADPGDFFWVICLVHKHMRLKVRVVADDQPTSTQEAIDTGTAAQQAADLDWASAAHERLSSRVSKHVAADGTVVRDVWVGYDNHFVSLFAMYPRRVKIRRGQTVRFHFGQLIYEDHSATMPIPRAREVAQNNFFFPVCDPDGDTGPGPDEPAEFTEFGPSCPGGPQELEFDIDAIAALQQGNGVFGGRNDFENSGTRGANQPSQNSFDVRFRRIPDGGVKYLCVIHPFMRGRIVRR